MKSLFVLTFILSSTLLFGQTSGLDSAEIALRKNSIETILAKSKTKLHDTVVADYYLQLADYASMDYDYALAISYCDSVLNSVKNLRFERLKEIEEQKANFLRKAGKSKEGLEILLRILKEYEAKKKYHLSAGLNNRVGILFKKMGDFSNAKYHLESSIEFAQKANDPETEGYARMSLGNLYKNEGQFKEAQEQYDASILIGESIGNKRLIAGNYNNYGSMLRMQKNLQSAKKYYKKAVAINKEIGNDKWLSYNYNNLGNIAKEEGNLQEALNYFLLSVEMKDKLGDARGKVLTVQNLADVYQKLGDYKSAYEYQRAYAEISDSVRRLDDVAENKKLAAQFQSEKRDAKIRELNMKSKYDAKVIEGQNAQLSYQIMIGWILGIGILLVLVIALLLLRTTRIRKRINQELIEKNEQIDRQHKEILDSINYASRIQNSILPGNEFRNKLLPDHSILFRPKDIISGDFYLCDTLDDIIFFGAVDCTGHGVPGAMVSLVASSHINKTIHEYRLSDPGEILTRLNAEIPAALNNSDESISDGMDMSLCALDLGAMQMRFAGAYQGCWVIASADSLEKRMHAGLNAELFTSNDFGLLDIKGDRRGIGKSSEDFTFKTQQLELAKGDILLVSSDGYQDQFGGPKNKKFMVKEMRNHVLSNAGSSPDQIVNSLDYTLKDWMSSTDQVDDICVFVVRV
jgi:serine phosphatase RsbU (regulator of sigma subunit)/Tfp pilus assembly protein PilF